MKRQLTCTSLVLLGLMLGVGCAQLSPYGREPARTSAQLPLDQAIQLARAYLVANRHENGQFQYRVNPVYLWQHNRGYHMQRHAGAMLALYEAQRYRPDPATVAALLDAGRFLASRVGPLPERPDLLGVWSLPADTGGRKPLQIHLGSVGLALTALVSIEEIAPDTTSRETLVKLGRFLQYMQKPDGSFYSRFIPSAGGRVDEPRSRYYPAEAALGLLALNELYPAPEWVAVAARALAYRVGQRKPVPGDQNLLVAIAKLQALPDAPADILPPAVIEGYVRKVSARIFEAQILSADEANRIGGFHLDGRTVPAARRIATLFAALTLIGDGDPLLRATIERSIRDGVAFLRRAQVTDGQFTGGVQRAVGRYTHKGRFSRRSQEIRIDYVRYALSAFIQYARSTASDT